MDNQSAVADVLDHQELSSAEQRRRRLREARERRNREAAEHAGRRIYRPSVTSLIVGLCDMQLRRMEAAGVFPKRKKLNPNGGKYGATGHDADAVDKWVEERMRSGEPESQPARPGP